MWTNVGGVLVNLQYLCYVRFEQFEDGALATLYFTDQVEPITFAGNSADDLRLVFQDLLGVKDEQEQEVRPEGGAEQG